MKPFFRAPVRSEVRDMAEKTVNVTVDLDSIECNRMWWGSVRWYSENLEVRLVDIWFAEQPIIKPGEYGSWIFHDVEGISIGQ